MAAIIFIFKALLQFLVVTLFLLRVLLPLVRADSRNEFSQAVMRLTNPLVLPLRKVLPPIGKVDTASLVALLVVQLVTTTTLWLLGAYPWVSNAVQFTHIMLVELVTSLLRFYMFTLFIYILLGWVAPNAYSPGSVLLSDLSKPLLRPVQRLIPPIAKIDFSAFFVLIGLQALIILIEGSITATL